MNRFYARGVRHERMTFNNPTGFAAFQAAPRPAKQNR